MPDLNPKADKPNYQNADYKDMQPAWTIVRDVSGGTVRMRQVGKTYLPKEVAEEPKAYNCRLNRSVFFNAYKRTRGALTGMVFKRNPTIAEDVPPEIVKQLENVDLAGTHIDVFSKELFEDAFEGHAFILVEMEKALDPNLDLSGQASGADEQAAGRRPYWVRYKADQAVNWRTSRINGEEQLTQITFKECNYEPDGEYGEKEVVRYRAFKRVGDKVTWELYRVVKSTTYSLGGEEEMELEDDGELSLSRIPVAIVYGKRLGLVKSEPPLLDLAYLNISHWQKYSDHSNILHVCQVPLFVRKGATTDQAAIEVGIAGTVDVPVEGEVSWVEVEGHGIEAGRIDMLDLEQRMAVMGLSILSQRENSNITATEKRQDFQEMQSELSTMARSLKDAMELALQFHAEYLGLELVDAGGSIELGVDEQELIVTPEHLNVLLSAVQSNNFSLETFLTVVLNLLGESGMLPDDIDVKDEVARVKKAAAANQAMALANVAKTAVKGAPPAIKGMFGAVGKPNGAPREI